MEHDSGSDAIVPENGASGLGKPNKDWSEQRRVLWKSHASKLQEADKAMYIALHDELEDPKSVHWARYYRHQHRHPNDLIQLASQAGHSWHSAQNGERRHGFLEETSSLAQEPSTKLCDQSVRQHHGYFNVAKGEKASDSKHDSKSYFYWLFEARKSPGTAPLILWLQGGPGCSSMAAVLNENGPCTVDSKGEATQPNQFGWNENANLMFIDQPAGVGFSTGTKDEMDKSEAEVSDDMYHFLQEMMKAHPEYHKNDLYIFGESFAGHYVPAAAHRIFTGNQEARPDLEYIALRGFGIGNGLTDPEIQYQSYPEMAFKPPEGIPPAVSLKVYEEMKEALPLCTEAIRNCKEDAAACKQAMLNCNIALLTPVTDTGVNVYDLRKKCLRPPGHCYHTANIGTYLNSHRVKTTLKVKQAWTECNSAAHQNLMGDWLKNYERHIPTMLKNGHTALIYAGDADYMCNWLGNQKWTQAMKWHGQKGYLKAPDLTWKVNGEVRGTVRHSDGLTFVRIHDAGHMVPRDAPGASLAMLQQYLAHQTLIVEA